MLFLIKTEKNKVCVRVCFISGKQKTYKLPQSHNNANPF